MDASQISERHAAISEVVGGYFTPAGVASWWKRPRHQLDGRTPSEVLSEDPERVMRLAEAGRSQG